MDTDEAMAKKWLYGIEFDEPDSFEPLVATWLGGDRYRLDEEPLFSEVGTFGDVIEAELRPDGILKFKRVVERSGYKTSKFLLTEEAVASVEFEELKRHVEHLGGEWSLAFKGYLMLHWPQGVDFDAAAEVRQMEARVRNRRAR